jgi:uncharacterized protein YggE
MRALLAPANTWQPGAQSGKELKREPISISTAACSACCNDDHRGPRSGSGLLHRPVDRSRGEPQHFSRGQGEASGPPDQAEVNAGVQILADTVIDATRENQAIIDRIMAALEEQGIPRERIQTSNYSIWAEQNYQDPRQQNRISGYRVSNVVTVRIDDVEKIGDVLAAVTNAGANTIHGIHFGVRNTAALEQKAREAAMADARARAEALAQLAGVQLGEVMSISTSLSGGPPRPMMARNAEMVDMASAPGISPGQQRLDVQIHATFAIR